MKIISFAGQASVLIAILAALFFELDVAQIKYKLALTLLIIGVSGLVAFFGMITLIRRYVAGLRVPADLSVLMLLCMIPSVACFYTVGLEGLLAPNLNDISTDVENPPLLTYAALSRSKDDNPPSYPVAFGAEQQEAYPEIKPLLVALPSREAFHIAAFTAAKLGWQTLYWNSSTGQIDLRDKTSFYAFKADITIRITAVDTDNSLINVRSASLNSSRDFGFNARRINTFFAGFNAELKKRQKH